MNIASQTKPSLKPKDAPDLGSFDWEDPLRLDSQLTEDERMIAASARAYAKERLQPRVTAAYAKEETDPTIFREMGEMGLVGRTVHAPLSTQSELPATVHGVDVETEPTVSLGRL